MNSSNYAVPNNLQLAKSAWNLNLVAGLGLTANSDIVSLYLEPQLGLDVTRKAPSSTQAHGAAIASDSYGLAYNVYAEIYITPLKNFEWYFEAQLGSDNDGAGGFGFNGTTGITWYLPAL